MIFIILISSISTIVFKTTANAALPAGTYKIVDVLAKDTNKHPKNRKEIWDLIDAYNNDGDTGGRTGWSAYKLECKRDDDGEPYWYKFDETRTDDSGRDKTYYVSEYKSEIIKSLQTEKGGGYDEKTATLIYEAALEYEKKHKVHLVYQEGSKSEPKDVVQIEHHPCKVGELGGYYNNLDFYLTMTFTVEEEETSGPSLRIEPPEQTIYVDEQAKYRAYWKDENGEEKEVTDLATWKVMDTSLATSEGQGLFTGTAKGSTTVTAVYNDKSATAYLEVLKKGEPPPEEPKPEPNEPPVAIIDAPEVVEIGEEFCLRSNSYDTDGYIKFYDWGFTGELADDDDGFTETTESKCGVYYEDPGEQEVWLQVTDDDGSSDDTTHTINVVYPVPDANFKVNGFPIENRAVWLTPNRPYGKNDTAEKKFKIVENKWTIRALDNENQSAIIVIEDDLNNSDYREEIELLFRKQGDYEVTHYIKNNRGQSDIDTEIITITEDLLPTSSVETSEVVYLNNQGKQTVTFEISSNSEDDYIGNNIVEIVHDSNNDGRYEEETWKTIANTPLDQVNYTVNKLGNYKVRVTSIETFDEQTYESHVDLSTNLKTTHRKYKQTETTFKVDNMAPVVSLDAQEQKEIEIIFNTGDVIENGTYSKSKLQSSINSTLLPALATKSINADIRVEEPKYYKDMNGGYYMFYLGSNDYRYKSTRKEVDSIFYYMSFDDGKLKRVNLPREVYFGRTFNPAVAQIDYDNNLYYNVAPEKNTPELDDEDYWRYYHWFRSTTKDKEYGTWAQTNVEIYKYDLETDSNTIFADKNFIIDKITEMASTNRDYIELIDLKDIIVSANENVYLEIRVRTGRKGKTSAYDEYYVYLLEFDKYGNYKRGNHFQIGNDSDDSADVTTITNNFIHFIEDGDNYEYIAIDDFFASEDSKNLARDVRLDSRMYLSEQYDYYYGTDTIYDEPGLFRVRVNQSTKSSDSSLLFKMDNSYNFEGLGRYYVYDYGFYNATRNGSLFTSLQLKEDDDDRYYFTSNRVFNDSGFALNNELQSIEMSTDLSSKSGIIRDTIFFREDGTYGFVEPGRVDVRGRPMEEEDKDVYIFDEKTNSLLKSIRPQTNDSLDDICSWDDDDDRCTREVTFDGEKIVNRLIYTQYGGQSLPVRAYKKTLADTLRDTEWKSETSTKYYVTLSENEIKGLPSDTEEVAALLDEKDIRYISIDTTSTKSIAQQIRDAIEQDSLQVTTTYTDSNMNNSMGKISDFIIGDLFPPEDPTIDIHIGVDDSQYNLSSIRTAINNILKPDLLNAGFTDINITAEALVNKTINGQAVRKFNTNKENEYYALFKDSALTSTNANHLVGDLLLQDAYFVGIGKQAAKGQFDTIVNKNMYRGLTIEEPTSLDEAMNRLSKYLIETIRAREGESVVYATTDVNKVIYKANYWDYENNPKFKEIYKTTHDPSVFENDQGKVSFVAGSLPEIFTKVGLYKPTYQAQDDPLINYSETEKSQFAEYRKWSNVADKAKIYIHRLPIADFVINFNKTTRAFSASNAAYDLDKQSINIGLGGGIAKQQFQWRKKGEITWKNGLPSSPLDDVTYEIKNEVTDFQNETAYLIKEVNQIGPPVAQFKPNPAVIEEGDSVNFINTSYEPTGEDMVAEWYYKKAYSGSYKLFATGNYVNNVPNANWNPTTNLLNQIGIYDIMLKVTDEDGLTDVAVQQVEVVKKTNNPPIACMQIPSPNYIGDTITIINCASDEDGDELTYSYKVIKPNGTTATYNTGHPNVASNGNLKIVADQHPVDLGTWTIIQTVSDGKEEATANGNMVVLDQTIQGEVAHTEQWLKNLQKYNLKNPSKAFNLNSSAGLLEFIPGERFVLYTTENTTNRLVSAEAYIKESSRGINYKSLYGTATLNRMDSKKFTGSLWDESMVEKFKDGEVLTFEFIGTFTNGWVDTHTVQIRIKDDPYWRQHTTY